MESGKRIRSLREERSLKTTDIERITKAIAEEKGNLDFYIPHSTLAGIEGGATPSIHKLFSLSLALRVSLTDLLLLFGIDPIELPTAMAEPESLLSAPALPAGEPAFRFQLNFDTQSVRDETTLLQVRSRELASRPPLLRDRFDSLRYRYALIGSKDDSMADFLPPRSLVEIDTQQKTIEAFAWLTLRERPIYLVWHHQGHSCCWCQLEGKELILIPHPLSGRRVRRFRVPTEAMVIGRVTNAWLPFDSLQSEQQAAG